MLSEVAELPDAAEPPWPETWVGPTLNGSLPTGPVGGIRVGPTLSGSLPTGPVGGIWVGPTLSGSFQKKGVKLGETPAVAFGGLAPAVMAAVVAPVPGMMAVPGMKVCAPPPVPTLVVCARAVPIVPTSSAVASVGA